MALFTSPGRDANDATDAALIALIQRDGSERAFRALYARHAPKLFQFLLRLLGGRVADAEDALQETWIRGCAGLDRFRGDSTFRTWIGGIARHIALDQLRRDKPMELIADLAETEGTPIEVTVDLECAIASLPDGYRAVLVLHDLEGFSHQEIGAFLGITEGTSKGQLFKARRALRSSLAGHAPVTRSTHDDE